MGAAPADCTISSRTAQLALGLVWQLASDSRSNGLRYHVEPHFSDDPWHRFFEKSWRLHQLPLAALFYLCGGWPWVVWGICARVIVSSAGHWTITHFCHRPGRGRWLVKGASVQASNLPGLGLITYGECWHNNHHAFPESARIGLERGQLDPAWWLIAALERLGVARAVGRPRGEASREDLTEAAAAYTGRLSRDCGKRPRSCASSDSGA